MKKKKGDKDMSTVMKEQKQKVDRKKLIQAGYAHVVKANGKALEKLSKN